jgi:hypothetical protein
MMSDVWGRAMRRIVAKGYKLRSMETFPIITKVTKDVYGNDIRNSDGELVECCVEEYGVRLNWHPTTVSP